MAVCGGFLSLSILSTDFLITFLYFHLVNFKEYNSLSIRFMMISLIKRSLSWLLIFLDKEIAFIR